MEIEWDADKAASNFHKHQVSFDDAADVFLDPHRVEFFDHRTSHDEDRWITIGLVEPAVLFVVYTVRGEDDEIIRIISARKADKDERAQYRENQT